MSEAEHKIQHRRENKKPLIGFDDLSTRLDRMCHLHSELTNISKFFNRTYSYQMLTTFFNYFADVLINVSLSPPFIIYNIKTNFSIEFSYRSISYTNLYQCHLTTHRYLFLQLFPRSQVYLKCGV